MTWKQIMSKIKKLENLRIKGGEENNVRIKEKI